MSDPYRILVVEDEYLLAIDLAERLEDAGFAVIGPVASVDEAFQMIDDESPRAAILDIQLPDGPTYPLADRLGEIGVPFLFVTGYTERDLPERFKQRPLVSKLAEERDLLSALDSLIGR
ncbi:response regulator (plasmid) [Rhizobium sp. T1470]|uniref:response regulator n=1 Tax=unclassified Rhizobium TaxID=2613769 RepID=UPI001AAFFFD4|nr:response regulator [Rhizobium sp. T1473]MCA0806739.1 response regulator [Rhizobium sp. T1473]